MPAQFHKYVLQGHLLRDGLRISCFLVIGLELQSKSYSKYLESIHDLFFLFLLLQSTFENHMLFIVKTLLTSLTELSSSSNSTIVPLFEKVLSASDAGRIGRLVLPKACAEVSLLSL